MTNVDPAFDPNVAHTVDPAAPTSGDAPQNPPADPAAAQPTPPPAPTPDPATSPAPAPTPSSSPQIDVLAATAQVAGIQRAAQAQPEPPPAPEPEFPKWNEGDLVLHRWTDPHGEKTAYGLVLAVTHDDGVEDRVEVLWISSDRSGGIPASQLEDPNEAK